MIGFDPSISHSAAHWARSAGDVAKSARFAIKSKPESYPHRLARLDALRGALRDELVRVREQCAAGLFVVEGYSFGSRAGQAVQLAEWGSLVRLTAMEFGWDVLEVPPTTLKKYVTGKGTAEKDGMRMKVLKRWDYESTDNNDCDAYALMRFGFDWIAWKGDGPTSRARAGALAKAELLPQRDRSVIRTFPTY